MEILINFIKKQPPGRLIAMGFLSVILVGSVLLKLPISRTVYMSYLDCLYTATSAVCVTGLSVVDVGTSLSIFGQIVLCILIQIGGLGVASVGAGLIMAVGKKLNLKSRNLIREGVNFDSGKGIIRFLRSVLFITFTIELIGAVLSFFVFIRDYGPVKSIWLSIFHSVASFNNAGFDILGTGKSLYSYTDDVFMNLVTSFLVITGGLGFFVMTDLWKNKFRFKKLRIHSKVAITMAIFLLAAGTVLFKITEGFSWLTAFFSSMTARTAGFATAQMNTFSTSGILIMCVLMLIGATSGSTGGGIKTGTVFVLFHGIRAAASNRKAKAFHYSISRDTYYKASVITFLAMIVIFAGTMLVSVFESFSMKDILFEMVSAFGTVGLSTGITGSLSAPSKIVTIFIMFTGRLGPLTIASLWHFNREERAYYPEANLPIG